MVLKEYTAHHNQDLPQQARNLRPPATAGSTPAAITRLATAQIRYRKVLGGVFERPRLAVPAISGAGRSCQVPDTAVRLLVRAGGRIDVSAQSRRIAVGVRSPAWSDSVLLQPLQDGFGDLCPAAVDGQGVTAVLELLQLGHGS